MATGESAGPGPTAAAAAEPVANGAIPRGLLTMQPGSTVGIGSLPHRNAAQAADFSISSFEIPTVPSLPRRSPAESTIAQGMVGLSGVTLGQYGAVAVDVDRLDPTADVVTDLDLETFGGLRAFLDAADTVPAGQAVKWQFVGPISLGVALCRAGAVPEIAFAVADAAVRCHTAVISDAITRSLPASPQIVLLDEPHAADLMSRDFPIAPDAAVDLLSHAMADLMPSADVGVHCCAGADVATLLESGPRLLSVPASSNMVALAGYVERFLANGGWIAWGAIATEGPVGVTSQRTWHRLSSLWCELVQRGCDPDLIRRQSLLTPECGLSAHNPAVADRICRALRDVARSARGEAAAARFVLGA